MLDLNPPLAKGTGLLMSFEWLGWQMLNTYGLEVTVKGDDSAGELDHNLHRLLFQMVRELLLNVVEHAQVKEAEITVETEEDGVTVTVSDEGRGFDIDRVMAYRGNGLGLRNIDVWLKLFGRGVEIKSAPGQGTQVTLFMPIVR